MVKVNIGDVAKYAGVSKKTVSRVLNHERNVSKVTREIVLKAFKELNYKPNSYARNLSLLKSFIIGFLYDNPSQSYITRLQSGAISACKEGGYNLLIHPSQLRGKELLDNIQKLKNDTYLDGLLLAPPFSDNLELMEFLKYKKIPFARVASNILDDDSISIGFNDLESAYEITKYLITLGHTKIGFIKGFSEHGTSEQRLLGYQKALEDSQIALRPEFITSGDFSYNSGEVCAKNLLTMQERPSAIFASNDYMAAAVLKVASQLKIAVPEQLSVAGFDNGPISHHIWPGLTTMSQPVEDMTYMAATKLIEQLSTKEKFVCRETLNSEFIIRESTGKYNHTYNF